MRTINYKSFSKYFLFLLVATCLAPGILSAQEYKGTFTLPVETAWGSATLPAGDYTLKIDRLVAPYLLTVRGEKGSAIIMAQDAVGRDVSGQDCLVVIRRGRTARVRTLSLSSPKSGRPEFGLVFVYSAPKGEPQLFAQGPELIQRIPIVAAGK